MNSSVVGLPTVDRLQRLDGVRAASIILVMMGHLLPLGPSALGGNLTAATLGMSLFFCLSGFLITKALLENPDIVEFAIRRLARILPASYAFVLIMSVATDKVAVAQPSMLLFYSNYQTDALFFGVSHFWSLCVEMHFYLFAAIAVAIGGRRALYFLPALCIVITGIRIWDGDAVSIETHLRVDDILAGATLCLFHFPNERFARVFEPARRFLGKSLFLIFPFWLASGNPHFEALLFVRPYLTFLFVAALMYSPLKLIEMLLSNSVSRYIAEISYALYLAHGALRIGYFDSDNKIELYLIKRPQTVALTFLIAHISTFYWEAWWRTRAKRLISAYRKRRG